MAGISSGQILRLKEVVQLGSRLDNKSVRTWGRWVKFFIKADKRLKVNFSSFECATGTKDTLECYKLCGQGLYFERLQRVCGKIHRHDNRVLGRHLASLGEVSLAYGCFAWEV